MQKVIILTEQEYEELKATENALTQRMKELDAIADNPEQLQEYVLEWLR